MIYTPSEVGRTTHPYVETGANSYGSGLPNGINQVCRCCKSSDTQVIRDPVELAPFNVFFTESEYKAYKCQSCGYKFSWYRSKE